MPKGRRNWCSAACVTAFKLEHDWQYIRFRVHKRDHGVCAICRCDCDKIARIERWVAHDGYYNGKQFLWNWLASIGFTRGIGLWQADHIVPRVLGGTNALENLRTVCIPCHKGVTAQLAASRAADRRDAKRPLLKG